MGPVKRPTVGVMGSGSTMEEHLASDLGRFIANHGFNLLTGGGGGTMTSVSKAFVETPGRKGVCMAVLPGIGDHSDWSGVREGETWFPPPGKMNAPPGYPNEYVEVPIFTHLPTSGSRGHEPNSRNHINVLTADVVVALPGGPGTSSELTLASLYGKPKIAFLGCEGEGGSKGTIVGVEKVPGGVDIAYDFMTVKNFILDATKDHSPGHFKEKKVNPLAVFVLGLCGVLAIFRK